MNFGSAVALTVDVATLAAFEAGIPVKESERLSEPSSASAKTTKADSTKHPRKGANKNEGAS